MTIDEIKKEVINRTGIPEELLTEETPEGVIARAKDLLAYKGRYRAEHQEEFKGETRDQFAAWFNAQIGSEEQLTSPEASLLELEQIITQDQKLYPDFRDGGECLNRDDLRTGKEKFVDWLQDTLAYDPRKHNGF